MIQNQPIGRVQPLVKGRENVTGRHLGENGLFRIRIVQSLVEAAARAGIVCLGVRIHQAHPAATMFQRIDAAAFAEEVEQVKLAALEIPTRTLSGAPVVELPQMNHRLLQEIFLKASVGSYRGHHPKQRGVRFWMLKSKRAIVDPSARLNRSLMGGQRSEHPIFHLNHSLLPRRECRKKKLRGILKRNDSPEQDSRPITEFQRGSLKSLSAEWGSRAARRRKIHSHHVTIRSKIWPPLRCESGRGVFRRCVEGGSGRSGPRS